MELLGWNSFVSSCQMSTLWIKTSSYCRKSVLNTVGSKIQDKINSPDKNTWLGILVIRTSRQWDLTVVLKRNNFPKWQSKNIWHLPIAAWKCDKASEYCPLASNCMPRVRCCSISVLEKQSTPEKKKKWRWLEQRGNTIWCFKYVFSVDGWSRIYYKSVRKKIPSTTFEFNDISDKKTEHLINYNRFVILILW